MVARRKTGKRKSKADEVLDAMQREQAEELEHQTRARDISARARLEHDRDRWKRKASKLEVELEERLDLEQLVAGMRADPVKPHKMKRTERSHGVKEAFAALLLSDLHFEEHVDPREVNGLNEYDLDIAVDRCDRLMVGFRWYLRMIRGSYKVRKAFMPMLGDNVTNWLHGTEDEATNFLTPFEALIFARERMVQLFDQVLAIGADGKEDPLDEIFVPIIPGNHDRMPGTRRNPHRGRTKRSLAFLLADGLRQHYRDEPRLKFELSYSGAHYTEIFGHAVRGVHGDGFKYNKGVGGIYVAARRYIKDLNSTINAPLTVFGHHHQFKTDRDWVSNGSLIGWSSYAANNAFPFEPAGQVAFAIDRDRGKRLPVLLQVQQADAWQ